MNKLNISLIVKNLRCIVDLHSEKAEIYETDNITKSRTISLF